MYSIAIHGGAGTLTRNQMSSEKEEAYLNTLKEAIDAGSKLLKDGKTALDAVEMAVCVLEDSPLFNAGKGSVFTHHGKHEMDASIMEGSQLLAGAVAGVNSVKNPISMARKVMQQTEHVLLSGEGAMQFAHEQKLEMRSEEYFYDELRYKQWQQALKSGSMQLDHTPLNEKKFGTVGAVALDLHANLAAATSTGGMTNKRFGRVGDTPIIGSGTYANNKTCAISCTGSGEFFLRAVVAYDVSCLMEYKNLSLQEACDLVIHERLLSIGGDGGLIGVDAMGNICMSFNTEGMYRAASNSQGLESLAIYKY